MQRARASSSSEPLGVPTLQFAADLATPPHPRVRQPLSSEIQNWIIASGLRQGDLLPNEPALCELFGVSRTALREAIRVLTALDIVEVRRGKGTFVGGGSVSPLVSSLVFRGLLSEDGGLDALGEILDVRIALDLGSAGPLCDEMQGTQDLELESLVSQMKALAKAGKPFPQQDRAFHTCLQRKLGSHLMTQLVTAFWDVHTALRPELGHVDAYRSGEMVAQAHADMLAAAYAGEPEAYREAVERHYVPIRSSLGSAGRD